MSEEQITTEIPVNTPFLARKLSAISRLRAGVNDTKRIFHCQRSPWVMKIAIHYHKWTKTWIRLSVPNTTVSPSEKQLATVNLKFKEGS